MIERTLPSGLVVAESAEVVQARERELERQGRDEYDKAHAVCPACGTNRVETTCMAVITLPGERYADRNRATCACGWRGTVDEMVAEKAT